MVLYFLTQVFKKTQYKSYFFIVLNPTVYSECSFELPQPKTPRHCQPITDLYTLCLSLHAVILQNVDVWNVVLSFSRVQNQNIGRAFNMECVVLIGLFIHCLNLYYHNIIWCGQKNYVQENYPQNIIQTILMRN